MCLDDSTVTKIHELGESEDLSIIFLTPNIENAISKKFLKCVGASSIDVRIIAVESSGNGFSFAKSWNKGIERFKQKPSRFLLFSHDDVDFTSDFLDNIYKFGKSHPSDTILTPMTYEDRKLISPFINFLPEHFFRISSLASHIPIFALDLFDGVRHSFNKRYFQQQEQFIDANEINRIPSDTYPRLFPVCLMSQSTIEKLSYFDESFFFGEDIEFTFRAILAGVKFGLIRSLSVNHFGSFNVGKRELKNGKEKKMHIHNELVAHRKLWHKYKYDYAQVKNMAKKNSFIF
jgi:GT2 family glycosyltransferase